MPTISTLTVDVQSRTSRFSKGLAVAIGGLAALATGAVYAFSKFEEAENVMQQTDAVLKSTGGAANVTARHINELSDAIARKAGVDDEVVQSGANMLLTFKNIQNQAGENNKIFDRTSTLMVDVAAGMAAANGGQINLKNTAIQLGKALNDPIAGMSALTRVGIQFSDKQERVITKMVESGNLLGAQKIILAELSSQFKGSAEANATASGKMQVAFENLVETIGASLAPAMTTIFNALVQFASFLQDNVGPALERVWEAIKPVAEIVGKVLGPAFEIAWHAIRDRLLPALEDLAPIFKLIGIAVVAFATVIAVQIAIVITIISHVIAIIGKIVDAFMTVVDWVREHLAGPISEVLGEIIDKLIKVGGWLKDQFLTAWNAIKAPVLAVIGAIVEAVKTLVGWIVSAASALGRLKEGFGGSGFGNFGIPLPIPGLATGGTVASTGIALIHKGETVVPAGTGMGGVTVNITGWVGNDQALARKIRDELNKLADRNVTTGIR